jgi:hypothetical protein
MTFGSFLLSLAPLFFLGSALLPSMPSLASLILQACDESATGSALVIESTYGCRILTKWFQFFTQGCTAGGTLIPVAGLKYMNM